MVGCSASNCFNQSGKGYRLFRLPKDHLRRAVWIENCQINNYSPGRIYRLCEAHFEEHQFECVKGAKKLASHAIPTIFSIVRPTRSSTKVHKLQNVSSENNTKSKLDVPINDLLDEISSLKKELVAKNEENSSIKKIIESQDAILNKFLTTEQIKSLSKRSHIWSLEGLVFGLKMRSALGVNGYNYLRSTNYPLPGNSTLRRRLNPARFNLEQLATEGNRRLLMEA